MIKPLEINTKTLTHRRLSHVLIQDEQQNKMFENNFEKLNILGKGSYGEVWLAKKHNTNEL